MQQFKSKVQINKKVSKTNYIDMKNKIFDKFSSFAENLKHSKFRKILPKKKELLIIILVILILIFSIFIINKLLNPNNSKVNTLKVYKSSSSRDENKEEKLEYKVGDPIQIYFEFTNTTKSNIEYRVIVKKVNNDTPILQIGVPITGDQTEGSRYITVVPPGKNIEIGEYSIEIFDNDNNILIKNTFKVI
jgi:hypothetical protein